MLGTEKLTKAVLLVVAVFNQAKESAADGIQLMDLFSFIDEFAQIPGVIATKNEILAELNDLDHAEREALEAAVAANLNVSNEVAKGVVIASIDTLVSIYNLVKAIKA